MLDALTDHILSQPENEFVWDDGTGNQENHITLSFTEKDGQSLVNSVRHFLREDLPNIIEKSAEKGALLTLRSFRKRWPEIKIDTRNETRHFVERLDLRWAPALDPLRMLLFAAREVGEIFIDRLARSRAKKGLPKRQAISVLHARACQTTLEILTLLENGLADGAYARWRTLHEIAVVAFVVDIYDDDLAIRYLAHDIVSRRDFIVNEYKYRKQEYDVRSLEGAEKDVEKEFQDAITLFGIDFAGPYGWAAKALNMKKPRFQDLEKAVNWGALSPDYKLSSYKIHAGAVGTIRSFSAIGEQDFLLAGATNAGLERPATAAAYSILQITSLVFVNPSDIQTQIDMRSLILVRDLVEKEAFRIATRLQRDELLLQKGYRT